MDNIKGKFHIKWANQGPLVIAILLLFYGYFGIFANMIMHDDAGHQLVYTQIDSLQILWNFELYPKTYFLPAILLLLISFGFSALQDIPEIGIKTAIWFVPLLIGTSFHWYSKINSPFTPALSLIFDGIRWNLLGYWKTRIKFGFNGFMLFFSNWKGYVMIIILLILSLAGSFGGIYLRKMLNKKRNKTMNFAENNDNK